MSRRNNTRKNSSLSQRSTSSSGDSFERRVPPSRHGSLAPTEFGDDGMYDFIDPSRAGASTNRLKTKSYAYGLQPAPMKDAATFKRRNRYANSAQQQLGPLDIARANQQQDGRDYAASSSSRYSRRSATRPNRPSSARKRIALRSGSSNERRRSQPLDNDRSSSDKRMTGLMNGMVHDAIEGCGGGSTRGRRDDDVEVSTRARERSRRGSQEYSGQRVMQFANETVPRKTRSSSSADEVCNVCTNADEETETEVEGTPDFRFKTKQQQKKARSLQESAQSKRRETISIDDNSEVEKKDEKPPARNEKPSLSLYAQSDLRKDTSRTIGKTRRTRKQRLEPTMNEDKIHPESRRQSHGGQAGAHKGSKALRNGVWTNSESCGNSAYCANVCHLSESENDMSQSMTCTYDDDKHKSNSNDSDQGLANGLSGLHVARKTEGSSEKKRKFGLFDDRGEFEGGNYGNVDNEGYDSEVELCESPSKKQAAGDVQQAIASIENDEVFIPKKLGLSKVPGTSETQGIVPEEPAKKTSPLDRGIEAMRKTRQTFLERTASLGKSLISVATRKKTNGKKPPTRIHPGEAVFAYHRDKDHQEEDEENERERKKARKQESSLSYNLSKKEASCSSDEKENDTFLPITVKPRRSRRLSVSPRKSFCRWKLEDSDDFYEVGNDVGGAESTQKRKKRFKTPEVIELEDSEDEKGAQQPIAASTGCDLSRLAIGDMVFDHDCKIAWVDDKLELSYTRASRTMKAKPRTVSHSIDCEREVTLIKYFVPPDENDALEEIDKASGDDEDDDQTCFVAFCVSKTGANGLTSISNRYKPDAVSNDDGRKFIIAEFRSDVAWQDFFDGVPTLVGPYFADSQLSASQTAAYTKSLTDHSKKQVSSSQRSPMSSGRTGGLARMNERDVLVVYPFGAKMSDIDATTEGLHELRGLSPDSLTTSTECLSSGDGAEAIEESKRSRAHYLTVRIGDYDRLEAGEFLNDTLIDFFLQWMVRHDDRSNIHVFSSHFYSTLLDEGPKGVTKWTKNKGIDIFSRKLTFIPINRSLHWSLCVVINPGHIKTLHNGVREQSCLPMPCLLFLDSLRAHQRSQVKKKVVNWLNSEWLRLGKDPALIAPFNAMKILSPRVPYQDNTWDCGVFACRYAYAVYQLRERVFSFEEMQQVHGEIDMISSGPEFDFGMGDITRIRLEMKTWLENLHRLYKDWRQSADEAEATEKAEKRRTQPQPRQPQESQDSSAVEVPDKNLQLRPNESDHRSNAQEDPELHDEGTHTQWRVATQAEVHAMEIDEPVCASGRQKHDEDSSEATKRGCQGSQHDHTFPRNCSESDCSLGRTDFV